MSNSSTPAIDNSHDYLARHLRFAYGILAMDQHILNYYDLLRYQNEKIGTYPKLKFMEINVTNA